MKTPAEIFCGYYDERDSAEDGPHVLPNHRKHAQNLPHPAEGPHEEPTALGPEQEQQVKVNPVSKLQIHLQTMFQ